MRKLWTRATALLICILLVFTAIASSVSAVADTVTGFPALDTMRSQLSEDEILSVSALTFTEGETVNWIDPDWRNANVSVFLDTVLAANGSTYSGEPGTFTAYYIVIPQDEALTYELSRPVTVLPAEEKTEEDVYATSISSSLEETDPDETGDAEASAEAEPQSVEESENDELQPEAESMSGAEEFQEEEPEPSSEEEPVEDEEPSDGEEDAPFVDEDEPSDEGELIEETDDSSDEGEPTEETDDPSDEDEPSEEVDDPSDEDEPSEEADDPSDEDESTDESEDGDTEAEEDDPSVVPVEDIDDIEELFGDEDDLDGEDSDSDEGGEIPPENIVISGNAKLERGKQLWYPTDLASKYSTFVYKIDGKLAYCLEAEKSSPKKGSFSQKAIEDNPDLCKALYYGYGGEGDLSKTYFKNYNSELRYILTHIACSYFYTKSYTKATKGCSDSGLSKYHVRQWIEYLQDQPDPPSSAIRFTDHALTSAKEDGLQVTESTTFEADSRNSVTFELPEGVTFVNETTGETATGAVTVKGGTTFHLTAPLTVYGNWSTGELSGKISKAWKGLVISTGTQTQHLGTYASEKSGASATLTVEWQKMARLNLLKVDAANTDLHLGGAAFGVYADADCTEELATMETDENGAATCELPRSSDTVYLKELIAPEGYRLNRTVYSVDLTKGDTLTVMVKDEEQRAGLRITKKGEVLTGADVSDNGVTFHYEVRKLAGAVYRLVAGSAIYNADGSLMFQKGDLVAENLTTAGDGMVFVSDLPLGTYIVEETHAPDGYEVASEPQTVTLSYAGQEAEAAFDEAVFVNERVRAEVAVTKQDADTAVPLMGATFALCAGEDITDCEGTVIVTKGTLIESVTTGEDGTVSFAADLPYGFSYTVRETAAPRGYVADDTPYTFTFTKDSTGSSKFEHTFADQQVRFRIELHKEDAETVTEQGDAQLSGAVYGLYAREEILKTDGSTAYEKDALITTVTTGAGGEASVSGLLPGRYYVKEFTPSVGYLLDPVEYDADCTDLTDGDSDITVEVTVKEQVAKQPFQIIKAANNGKTDADLIEHAGFSAWLISDLIVNEDGSYDFSSADPIVIGADGATEIFTDAAGHAVTVPLPYGQYVVRETTTPANFSPVDDFTVTIVENKPKTPQVWRVLLDEEFSAKLKIVKVDETTGRAILVAGAEFSIYDVDNDRPVTQATSYPHVEEHTTFKTDETGTLTLPETLLPGHYRVTEVSAPDGYLLNPDPVDVIVSDDALYLMDSLTGDPVIEVTMRDREVKGCIAVYKEGEMLTGYADGQFIYENRRLAGVTFEVYAAEDIFTPDHQLGDDGNRRLEYAEGALVTALETDANGEATSEPLPLGTYNLVEKQTADGYVLDAEPHPVTLGYEDDTVPVVVTAVSLMNERQKFAVSVEKQSSDGTKKLPGVEFALYAGEDICADGEVLVGAGACLTTAVTDETGTLTFDIDLPAGSYLIGETKAPDGYLLSDEVQEVKAIHQGQNVPSVALTALFKDEPVKVAVSKTDATTGVELDGAKLTLLNADGDMIDSWTSVAGEPHLIEGLMVGATYTLREEIAPYGYLIANAVKFTVSDTGEVQKVVMTDETPTGTILINKTGEFLSDVSFLDGLTGRFSYLVGGLKNVSFDVFAAEDIPHADGATANWFNKGDFVTTITTDATGVAKLEGLPLGRYTVTETQTGDSYVLDTESRVIDLTYRDDKTKVVTYSEAWQNERRKAEVKVVKLDETGEHPLEGAVFELCAGEDITSNGQVILEKYAAIEQRSTDSRGTLTFEADLPVGFEYYIYEAVPPAGYASDETIRTFTPDGEALEFTFTDKPTQVEISKTALTTGEELEGAHLQITDETGSVVESWISGTESHRITGLTVGNITRSPKRCPQADTRAPKASLSPLKTPPRCRRSR